MTLHEQLQQLADTAPRPAVDHAVWDRGRALRRRDRLVTSAVVLVMVVILGGLVAVVTGPPRAFAPAGETVPEGAIPSQIVGPPYEAGLPIETDLAIGRGSVAFVSGFGYPVVIGASDGRYHRLELTGLDTGLYRPLALSPDGRRLAWADPEGSTVRLADLETGELSEISAPWAPRDLRWTPDGGTLLFVGTADGTERAGRLDVSTGEASRVRNTLVSTTGYPSPDGSISAVAGEAGIATFVTTTGRTLTRTLPADVYPDGASIQPLGWTEEHLVVASVEGVDEDGSPLYRQLVLFTSPDQPRREWTFRILARDRSASPLSVAVDLIPDLDGTSSQQLTHDFREPDWPGQRDMSWIIGLGVAGALSVLYGLRWLWRRRTLLV